MPARRTPTARTAKAKARSAKAKPAPRIDLSGKAKPLQRRSQATYDMILEVTGKLLEEVGVEQLSTNLVCRRAGLTPPALYRYFPNKYALLQELGRRLMALQDEAAFEHIQNIGDTFGTVEEEAERLRVILDRVNDIARKFPGGVWVLRALRAIPTLSAVRIQSREVVTERAYRRLKAAFPHSDPKQLRTAARLSVEVLSSSTELVLDQPELDTKRIATETSYMIALYRASFADPMRKSHLPD